MVKILVVLKLLKITWLVQSSPQEDQPHNQVHNCIILLCSLDEGYIDDQCRRPSMDEKGHLAG